MVDCFGLRGLAAWAMVLAGLTTSLAAEDLVATGASVEQLADGFLFTEGPACDSQGNVFFSDIPNSRIHKWSVDGELTTFREETGRSNGLYFDRRGNLLACEGGSRRLTSISPEGHLTVLVETYQGKRLNSPNDLWIDPVGGIYFTDPRYGKPDETMEVDGFHVYYLPPDGKPLVRVIDDLVKPNGIIGTADGKRLYVADHGGAQTYAYRIEPDATLTDRQLIAPIASDGLTLDERGNLYLTQEVVHIYTPEGKPLTTIEPPEAPANVCFGGADRRTLFITARKGLYAIRMNVRGQVNTPGQPTWPCFHGPLRDNVSRETGLLTQWPDGGPPLAWRFGGCGNGFSGVSLAEGLIFTAGDFDKVEKVLALDLDGKPVWQVENGSSWRGPYAGSRTTPAYDDGMVYQLNPIGRLAAWKARTGEEVWVVDLVERFGARYGTWSLAENVVIEGDLVYCTPGGPRALIAALDKKTGRTVWTNTSKDETAAYCSPILVTHNGRRQLITLTQKSIVSVDVKTGELLWSHPHVTPHDQNVNAPVYHDGHVFVASGHSGGGRLVKLADDSSAATEVWWNRTLDNCHGGVMLIDGRLYGSACRSGGRGFFCADLATGEVLFRERRMEKLSLTLAAGLIHALTQRGDVLLIRPRADGLDVISRFSTPEDSTELAWAHPIVCDGRLYLRRGEYLYAYDIRDR